MPQWNWEKIRGTRQNPTIKTETIESAISSPSEKENKEKQQHTSGVKKKNGEEEECANVETTSRDEGLEGSSN